MFQNLTRSDRIIIDISYAIIFVSYNSYAHKIFCRDGSIHAATQYIRIHKDIQGYTRIYKFVIVLSMLSINCPDYRGILTTEIHLMET